MEQKYCISCDEPVIEKLPPCPLQCMSPKCKAYQKKPRIDSATKPIVWVLGGPGSGKLTQCQRIVETYGFTHLSTGELLREEINAGSARSKCLSSIMERGGLVPNDIVLALLKEAMMKAADNARGFLVDGYPREKSQGMEFEKTIAPVSASFDTLNQRLANRGKTSGRKDDNLEVIKLRLQTFLEYNPAVIEAYNDKVIKINAEQDSDKIFSEVKNALTPVLRRAQEAIEVAAVKAASALVNSATALPTVPATPAATAASTGKPRE